MEDYLYTSLRFSLFVLSYYYRPNTYINQVIISKQASSKDILR